MRRWKNDEEEAKKEMEFILSELSSISVLEWAWERIPFEEDSWSRRKAFFFSIVAKAGNVELVRWLREEKQCPWSRSAWEIWSESTRAEAGEDAHLECLKYLHGKGCP